MTNADWNCHSEESEATRNLSIIIQISPPASFPEGIVSLEMISESDFVIILIMSNLLILSLALQYNEAKNLIIKIHFNRTLL